MYNINNMFSDRHWSHTTALYGELEVDRKGSLWKRVTDYVLTKTPLFKHLILKKARENVSYQLKF